ncbi:MAG: AraC family transcriptional regulator [Oscillospiraceae bacterium]|nr:AraC family transcriptional regulator [Oscillospiraceae bacterium]
MDILKQLNKVIYYTEENLEEEISPDIISQIACTSYDSFCRFFSYITGITFAEYIRRRKLTKAAYDLRSSDDKVIDIAVKYGYSGADVFRKAFTKQHGIPPTAARDVSVSLNVYPPVSFHVIFKGAEKMNFRIVETEEIEVYGVSRHFNGTSAERYEMEHTMWATDCDFVPSQICEGFDGKWYGIWNDGHYMIARDKSDTTGVDLEKDIIPTGTYAAFTTEKGGYAGDELPKLHDLIFNSWLPDSGYVQAGNLEIEVYHLRTGDAERKKNRYYEIWIPIKEK